MKRERCKRLLIQNKLKDVYVMVELHKRRVDEMVKAENKRKANELEEKIKQDEAKKKEK